MKKLNSIFIAVIFAAAPAFATIYGGSVDTTSTTLSAALPATTNTNASQQVCVASSTGIAATSISATGTYLVVGREAMQVTTAGSSSTCWNVKRGQLGSSASYGHFSGETVWVGNVATGTGDSSRPFSGGPITPNVPNGTCVASSQYSLPVIYVGPSNASNSGHKFYCTAGVWTDGEGQAVGAGSSFTGFTTFATPGNVVAPTPITDVSGKVWFSQIFVGANFKSTGACILNGTGAGTDSYVFGLWDAAGNLLNTTALAGTASSGASLMQCIAWVNPMNLTGPNAYFVGVQGNGSTAAQFSAYKTGQAPVNYPVGVITGGSFGTLVAIATPPVTFTTAVGPLMSLY